MKIDDFFERKQKSYIIAEVSQNHDGSLGQAHAFIDAVAKTGADAIKFQTHIADEESTLSEPFRIKFSYCDKTRYDYWKRMEFTFEQWTGLFEHAKEKNLDFLSSPFSVKALEMLQEIGVPAWKFGSGEVFNEVLLNKAIETGKPIILSTGLSTLEDIDRQVKKVQGAGNPLLLMECTTEYPSAPERIPIHMIHTFCERYHCPVGLSDHSATIFPSLSAITLGATAIEVHVTMSREMFGPDVKSSVTLEELKTIVEGTKFINKMLSSESSKMQLNDEKIELRRIFSKCIYAKCNLNAGEVLTEEKISIKKPYNANAIQVEDYEKIIGKTLGSQVNKDSILTWENIKE